MPQSDPGRADTDALETTTETTSRPMVDSGYESDTGCGSEPTDRQAEDCPHPEQREDPAPPPSQTDYTIERRMQIPELDGLTQFVGNVSADILERFQDITERLGGPLIAYMRKECRDYRPTAIRLMILGEDHRRARPWIVVLCPKHVTKRAKKFFQKKFARSMLEPSYPSQPRFDIAVIDQPPYPLGPMVAEITLEKYIKLRPGLQPQFGFIKLQGGKRFVTIGGIVKVTDDADREVFYGLTAGHVIDQDYLSRFHDEEILCSDSDGEIGEPSTTKSDDGTSEGCIGDEVSPVADKPSPFVQEWSPQGPTQLQLSTASFSAEACNHDWGLITCDDPAALPPNLVQENHHAPLAASRLVLGGDGKPNRAVVINTGVLSSVTLSVLPTMMLMPNGKRFVPVHSCSIRGTSNVSIGNSGSWIFSEYIGSVYGQVVAEDVFGDLLMVPITCILEDIKQVLKAKEVNFPTPLQLASLSLQRPLPGDLDTSLVCSTTKLTWTTEILVELVAPIILGAMIGMIVLDTMLRVCRNLFAFQPPSSGLMFLLWLERKMSAVGALSETMRAGVFFVALVVLFITSLKLHGFREMLHVVYVIIPVITASMLLDYVMELTIDMDYRRTKSKVFSFM